MHDSLTWGAHLWTLGRTPERALPVAEALQFAQDANAELLYVLPVSSGWGECTGKAGFFAKCAPGLSERECAKREIIRVLDMLIGNPQYAAIRRFQLGNEPWSHPEYAQFAYEIAQIIKQRDPTLQVGIVGYPSTGDNQGGNPDKTAYDQALLPQLTKTCNGVPCFDFVTDHLYARQGYRDMANQNFHSTLDATEIERLVTSDFRGRVAYWPGNVPQMVRDRRSEYGLPVAVTEWNTTCWPGRSDIPYWFTTEQGLHTAGMLASMAKGDAAASHYHLLGPTAVNLEGQACAVVYGDHTPTAMGQAIRFMSGLRGLQLVDAKVQSPRRPLNESRVSCAANNAPDKDMTCTNHGQCSSGYCDKGKCDGCSDWTATACSAPYCTGNPVPDYLDVTAGYQASTNSYVVYIIHRGERPLRLDLRWGPLAEGGLGTPRRRVLSASSYADRVFNARSATTVANLSNVLVEPRGVTEIVVPRTSSSPPMLVE